MPQRIIACWTPALFTLIGKQIPAGLPVHSRCWRDDSSAALRVALVGAAVMLAVSLLLLQTLQLLGLLALVAIAAAVGAGWSLRRNRRANLPLSAQHQALQDGELLIAADLPDVEAPRLEERVNQRHPELLVLGSDAGGSPPFPWQSHRFRGLGAFGLSTDGADGHAWTVSA